MKPKEYPKKEYKPIKIYRDDYDLIKKVCYEYYGESIPRCIRIVFNDLYELFMKEFYNEMSERGKNIDVEKIIENPNETNVEKPRRKLIIL